MLNAAEAAARCWGSLVPDGQEVLPDPPELEPLELELELPEPELELPDEWPPPPPRSACCTDSDFSDNPVSAEHATATRARTAGAAMSTRDFNIKNDLPVALFDSDKIAALVPVVR